MSAALSFERAEVFFLIGGAAAIGTKNRMGIFWCL